MKMRQEHSANLANRGRGCGNPGRDRSNQQPQQQRGRGGNSRGRGRGNNSNQRQGGNGVDNRPKCQLCYKRGHTVIDCWYRYDEDFVPDEKYAGTAASYGVDSNWYVDTGATDHVTGELEKLTIRNKYKGQDQVQTANGAGMVITHIGHSVVNTPSRPLYLKNILYVPNASKNLISAYRLMVDTAAYFELYPKHFSLKDQATKETFLRGRCRGRLFPLSSSSLSTQQDKEALAATTGGGYRAGSARSSSLG
jgi:histone deacetylase 1/2